MYMMARFVFLRMGIHELSAIEALKDSIRRESQRGNGMEDEISSASRVGGRRDSTQNISSSLAWPIRNF